MKKLQHKIKKEEFHMYVLFVCLLSILLYCGVNNKQVTTNNEIVMFSNSTCHIPCVNVIFGKWSFFVTTREWCTIALLPINTAGGAWNVYYILTASGTRFRFIKNNMFIMLSTMSKILLAYAWYIVVYHNVGTNVFFHLTYNFLSFLFPS